MVCDSLFGRIRKWADGPPLVHSCHSVLYFSYCPIPFLTSASSFVTLIFPLYTTHFLSCFVLFSFQQRTSGCGVNGQLITIMLSRRKGTRDNGASVLVRTCISCTSTWALSSERDVQETSHEVIVPCQSTTIGCYISARLFLHWNVRLVCIPLTQRDRKEALRIFWSNSSVIKIVISILKISFQGTWETPKEPY